VGGRSLFTRALKNRSGCGDLMLAQARLLQEWLGDRDAGLPALCSVGSIATLDVLSRRARFG